MTCQNSLWNVGKWRFVDCMPVLLCLVCVSCLCVTFNEGFLMSIETRDRQDNAYQNLGNAHRSFCFCQGWNLWHILKVCVYMSEWCEVPAHSRINEHMDFETDYDFLVLRDGCSVVNDKYSVCVWTMALCRRKWVSLWHDMPCPRRSIPLLYFWFIIQGPYQSGWMNHHNSLSWFLVKHSLPL